MYLDSLLLKAAKVAACFSELVHIYKYNCYINNNLHKMAAMANTIIFNKVSCLSGDIRSSHCGPQDPVADFILQNKSVFLLFLKNPKKMF